MARSTAARVYSCSFSKNFRISFLDLRTSLPASQMYSFDIYHGRFQSTVIVSSGEMRSHIAAFVLIFRKLPLVEVPVLCSDQIVTVLDCTFAASRAFGSAKQNTCAVASVKSRRDYCSRLASAVTLPQHIFFALFTLPSPLLFHYLALFLQEALHALSAKQKHSWRICSAVRRQKRAQRARPRHVSR